MLNDWSVEWRTDCDEERKTNTASSVKILDTVEQLSFET
jgi:hypothetical protein